VKATCSDLERALRGDDGALVEAFARHVESCPACQAEKRLSDDISAAASLLRKEWPTPLLQERIREQLRVGARPTRLGTPAVLIPMAVAACLLVAFAARTLLRPSGVPAPPSAPIVDVAAERLLSERALADVEKAEEAYLAAIDALSRVAEGRLVDGRSPVFAAYREKLLVLDAAIADCQAEARRNRFNAHLRLEMLSIYQEKQRTLESLLKEDPHAS
jgi:hypothetical protein